MRSSNISNRRPLSCGSRPRSSASGRTFVVKAVRRSEVDPLLFGHQRTKNNNSSKPTKIIGTKPQSSASKSFHCDPHYRVVRVVSQEFIRHLHEQKEQINKFSLKLPESEYRRLLDSTSKSLDITRFNDKLKSNIIQKEKEANDRRLEFSNYDKIRITQQKNTDIQKINEEISRNLIKKAWEERVDNEEEVKEITNMIKNAKIQTIRDKQIKDNKLLKQIRKEEDLRLESLVQKENHADFLKQQQLDNEKQKKELIGAYTMYEQIEENKRKRLMELDQLVLENIEAKHQAYERVIDHMKRDEIARELQRKKKEEFLIANKSLVERKLIKRMEERLIDENILKVQMEKDEIERIKEEEILRKKKLKEIEYSKIREMQERFQDLQVKRDELLERRANEDMLRKWRDREIEEEIKKKQDAEKLDMIRAVQKHLVVVRNATEATREKELFKQHYQKEKALLDKDKLEEKTKQNKKHLYAKALNQQIEQNKAQNIINDYRLAMEREKIVKDNEMRKIRIKEAQYRQLEESRLAGVSEKYLLEIENRINNPISFIRH